MALPRRAGRAPPALPPLRRPGLRRPQGPGRPHRLDDGLRRPPRRQPLRALGGRRADPPPRVLPGRRAPLQPALPRRAAAGGDPPAALDLHGPRHHRAGDLDPLQVQPPPPRRLPAAPRPLRRQDREPGPLAQRPRGRLLLLRALLSPGRDLLLPQARRRRGLRRRRLRGQERGRGRPRRGPRGRSPRLRHRRRLRPPLQLHRPRPPRRRRRRRGHRPRPPRGQGPPALLAPLLRRGPRLRVDLLPPQDAPSSGDELTPSRPRLPPLRPAERAPWRPRAATGAAVRGSPPRAAPTPRRPPDTRRRSASAAASRADPAA
jgi:hypothetical protein